jgi:hypothetical protein
MNTQSFSDEPEPRPGFLALLRSHALIIGSALSVLLLAVGVHFAAKTAVVVGVGHLVVVLAIGATGALRRRARK